MRSEWIEDDERNVLSATNLGAVQSCFSKPGAVVFGWHYHFYGGSSRSDLVFGSADDLIRHMDGSRPGDHFTLYDLDRVAPDAILHLGAAGSGTEVELRELDRSRLAEVAERSRWKAVVFVQRAVDAHGRVTRCSVYEGEPDDLTDNWSEARLYAVQAMWPQGGATLTIDRWPGEVFAFDEAVLDLNDETGRVVEGVDPADAKRSRALIDAKRPNASGRVPQGGAY